MTIYCDNAATSWPKPREVREAVQQVFDELSGNPNRGGYRASVASAAAIAQTRRELAKLIGARDNRIAFTLNTTDALNIAINGVLRPGDHAVVTAMAHNSVVRPLEALDGVAWDEASSEDDLMRVLRPTTKLLVISHASNVTGVIQPVQKLAAIAKARGVLVLVDAAQTAGVVPINVDALGIDMLAAPGHKGLLGPSGTGFLYVREGVDVRPLRTGGSGSHSEQLQHPTQMPERLEAGTPNVLGIVGLGAALRFLRDRDVWQHEQMLLARFVDGVRSLQRVKLLGHDDAAPRVGIACINVEGFEPNELAAILDEAFGIAVRAGLHCAPAAHRMLGTLPRGAVRFSFGYANTTDDVDACISALKRITTS